MLLESCNADGLLPEELLSGHQRLHPLFSFQQTSGQVHLTASMVSRLFYSRPKRPVLPVFFSKVGHRVKVVRSTVTADGWCVYFFQELVSDWKKFLFVFLKRLP